MIQEGVVFEGQCNMGDAQRPDKDRKVTPFPSEGAPREGASLKVHSEGTK